MKIKRYAQGLAGSHIFHHWNVVEKCRNHQCQKKTREINLITSISEDVTGQKWNTTTTWERTHIVDPLNVHSLLFLILLEKKKSKKKLQRSKNFLQRKMVDTKAPKEKVGNEEVVTRFQSFLHCTVGLQYSVVDGFLILGEFTIDRKRTRDVAAVAVIFSTHIK